MSLLQYENQKWLIGVSGGPDSMALLDMAYHAKVLCIVVHINYHQRPSADRDQKIVSDYCQANHIPLYVYDAHYNSKGNFQAWARNFRYDKMQEFVKANDALGIMVAHHLNDHIETFIMQEQRHSLSSYYGLQASSILKGVRLVRPLLSYSKQDLLNYCHEKDLAYGLDESNEDTKYTRNRIRQTLSSITKDETKAILARMDQLNHQHQTILERYQNLLDLDQLSMNEYNSILDYQLFLFEWIQKHTGLNSISMKYLNELNRQIQTSTKMTVQLDKKHRFIKQYDTLSILSKPKSYHYTYQLNDHLKTPYFSLLPANDQSLSFLVDQEDFPLRIIDFNQYALNNKSDEVIKIRRYFIKYKIPIQKRDTWPIVLNKQDALIYMGQRAIKTQSCTNTYALFMIK